MKYLKMLGLAAMAAMALTALLGAGSASATTHEKTGVPQNGPVTIEASIKAGGSAILRDTENRSVDTCTGSTVKGTTVAPYSGTSVGGPVSSLTFTGCTHTTHVVAPGNLSISHITGTTNGTVTSSGAEVQVQSTAFGVTLTCKTGTGTDIGTLTGVKHGQATMHINGIVNCGFFVPTAKWEGTYTVTTEGIGVSA
jgi:hypothetical protein